MSKVTSKLQVTIPKRVADQYGIKPGTEVEFEPAGQAVRMRIVREGEIDPDRAAALARFKADEAYWDERFRKMREDGLLPDEPPKDRGWTREELYGDRG